MKHKSEDYKLSAVEYYLSRSKNNSTGLDEPVKPKFTRSVKGKPC